MFSASDVGGLALLVVGWVAWMALVIGVPVYVSLWVLRRAVRIVRQEWRREIPPAPPAPRVPLQAMVEPPADPLPRPPLHRDVGALAAVLAVGALILAVLVVARLPS